MIVGLDMGGTHIDAIVIKDNKIIKVVKHPTDFNNLYESIWNTLKDLFKGLNKEDIKKINLSTTVSTNAIIENKISKVGMIIQSGPGLPNDHLKVGYRSFFIKGYTDHRGKIVSNYNEKEVKEAIRIFEQNNIDDIAIISKFSTRNPKTELDVKKIAITDFDNITLGHKMSGKLNFPRRINTAYLNAAVYKTFNKFAKSIELSLAKEGILVPVSILKADGGVMSLNYAKKMPIETILSGPAASFMGMNALLETKDDAILLDIGGTTTDIFFLSDGVPLFEPLGTKISNHNTLVRAIYSYSIGLGGDSAIKIENDKIKIGPIRKGSPYALGGPLPTPTDAMIVAGKLDIGDKKLATKAIESLSNQLNTSTIDTANKIIDLMGDMIKSTVDNLLLDINSKPVYTIKELLHNKELKPKTINVIGGPAKILSKTLKSKFGITTNYPKNYEVANAIGAALAITTTEINMIANTDMQTLSVAELGIHKQINRNYKLSDARKEALNLLRKRALSLGANEEGLDLEIIEESVFNMVDGFRTKGQNIRIRAQVKPGLSNIRIGDINV